RSLLLGKGQGFALFIGPGMLDSHDVTGFNFTVSTVPEPMTWAMMIVGIGLIGGAMRRQRRTVRYTFA
ncbi:MAG TPA: PEPxxWA-CTERM sorting domain-containing protein, partial [Novosphingobium sp.]